MAGTKQVSTSEGLAQLEAQERDRCAGFAAKAVAAGLAERTVRIAEDKVSLWWRWSKPHCEKLIFHRSRYRRSRLRWRVRRES
jgi:hypothetical protein